MNNTQSESSGDDVGGHGFRAPDAADAEEHNEDVQGHGRFSGLDAETVDEEDTEGHGRWSGLDVETTDDEQTDTEGHGFRGN